MHIVNGEQPGGFSVHEVNPFSSRVWHGRSVRSRPESHLRQRLVAQEVLPDIREPTHRAAEHYGLSSFGPHHAGRIRRYQSQINGRSLRQIYFESFGTFQESDRVSAQHQQAVAVGERQNPPNRIHAGTKTKDFFLTQSRSVRSKDATGP